MIFHSQRSDVDRFRDARYMKGGGRAIEVAIFGDTTKPLPT